MTTDVPTIRTMLTSATVGVPITHGAVTVFPLHHPVATEPDWLTLADAGAAVAVTEVTEAGDVPTLQVKNASDRAVLLLDGEELVGAKQNRVLNTTVLVAALGVAAIPVSCVEQGRWSYRGRRSAAGDTSLYASLRRKKAARVSESLRARGRHESDQGDVWDELAAKAAFLRVESPTGAMHAVYEKYRDDIGAARDALAAQPGQTGAMVYVAGRWAGLEVLASPSLFARAWPRVVAGYAADALGLEPGAAPDALPEDVLARVTEASLERAPAVGLGVEYRLGGAFAVGAALVVDDDALAHLAAFPAIDADGEDSA